ncbi:Crp/Fnr family transcriptional regulator [Chitinimonas taiwanensis]|uniref:Crp/Fnr family transcriptional regulator n=1 Tax=Chitinimonas taiwanensis TaxID=240412 RepID=UPI0035AEBC8D
MAHKLDIDALLARLPLFRNLDAAQLALMARASQQVRVAKHQFVFHRGDPANGLYVVAVGGIKLAIPSPSGQEKVIEFFAPGQAFGEAVMFLDKPYMVQAQALEDTLLIWIDKQDIYAAIDHDPSFAKRMLAGLSLRLHALVQDIETINLQNASQRVISFLLKQPREGGQVHFPFNKNVIASKLGLTPETLSRLLHQLSAKNLIRVDGRDVQILDPEALEAQLYGG